MSVPFERRINGDKIKAKISISLWWFMVKKDNLNKLINLNFLEYTNQSYLIGKYDLPYARCPDILDIDYLALYSERNKYFKTDRTAICFYQYDIVFDGPKGLFNAIYFQDKKLLDKYKKRFEGIRFFIAPDYSLCGDVPRIENIYRLFKSRIVSNFILLEWNALVIPNITYGDESYFEFMLDGLENTNTVSFSIKGVYKNQEERKLLLKAIKYTVDNLKHLKTIIVYSVLNDDNKIYKLFEYATSKNLKIIIPNNTLRERNISYRKESFYGEN